MTKIDLFELIEEFKESREKYLSSIGTLEETVLDPETKEEIAAIIQETQTHEEIALEQIQE